MFSMDQTHLRRYFATLGVAIAVGTLSLAGVFLKLQQDLVVPESTLAKLTPAARSALLRRQEYLSFGVTILPWFVLVGFFGGLTLSIYGIIGWVRRQRISDEREDIELRKGRAELDQMTDIEKADKLDREAEEAVAGVAYETPTERARLDIQLTPVLDGQLPNVRTGVAVIENELLKKLVAIYGSNRVESAVRVGTAAGSIVEVDAFVRLGNRSRIVFELKYSATTNNVLNRIVAGLQNVARAASTVNGQGVLVVVAPSDATLGQLETWRRQAEEMAAEYRSVVKVYVGRYSEFVEMHPSEFAESLGLEQPNSPVIKD
jgi:hypothetical protein